MVKRHIIACSGALGLFFTMLILLKLSIKSEVTPVKSDALRATLPKVKKPEIDAPSKTKSGFYFADEQLPAENKKAAWKMSFFLKRSSYKYVQSDELHKRAKRWFPIIEPILEQYGIPEDFKYIPLVENGTDYSVSPKGAAGYWQFMPQTARVYGLRVGRGEDERHDLEKSTRAACRYIKSLYAIFDNWTLVAAAYNLGENSLKASIQRQKSRNYYSMRLNRETATYVYKLISMKEIIKRPRKYGYPVESKVYIAQNNTTPPAKTFLSHQQERKVVDAFSALLPSNTL